MLPSATAQPLRVLLFSSLYPSSALPRAGIFVETRLRELLKTGRVAAKVVAPVRWSPVHHPRFGVYAQIAAAPRRETLHGIDVLHPRVAHIPKIGMNLAPLLMALGAAPALRRLRAEGFDFELIDAHYFYPDGVAAALLARWFDRPLAITARGSDVNVIPGYAGPRWQMRRAADQAATLIGVSEALTSRMRDLGFDAAKLTTMRNGVDLSRFRLQDRAACRARLGLTAGPVVLTVGNLKPSKGQRLVVQALPAILQAHPDAQLVVLGDGPDAAALAALVRDQGLASAVRFVAAMPQAELPAWYGAADVLVLASDAEGWPNVLLEAMACGTPVVASDVGGVREMVHADCAGRVLPRREPQAVAAAVCEVLRAAIDPAATRRHAEDFSWDATSLAQLEAFARMAGRAPEAPGLVPGPIPSAARLTQCS